MGQETNKGGVRGTRRETSDNRPRPVMHSAVCHECGMRCDVPFKPTAGKPVLCGDCYRKENGGTGDFKKRDSAPRRHSSDRDGGGDRVVDHTQEIKQINEKLDRIIETLGIKQVKRDKAPKKEVNTEDLKNILGDIAE